MTMRGITRLLLCTTALALSSGAWGQEGAGTPLTEQQKVEIVARLDKLEAEAKSLRQLLEPEVAQTERPSIPATPAWSFDTAANAKWEGDLQLFIAAIDREVADPDKKSARVSQAKNLRALQADTRRYRQDWLSGVVAARETEAARDQTFERLQKYRTEANKPGNSALATVISREEGLLKDQNKKLTNLIAEVGLKYQVFSAQKNSVEVARNEVVLEPDARVELENAARASGAKLQKIIEKREELKCSLDNEEALRSLEPNDCRFLAEAEPVRVQRSQGAISLPDRPVDRRGVTTQLTTSGDKAAVTLKLAGSIKRRTFDRSAGDPWQRADSISYSVGITADVADSKSRIAGDSEKEKDLSTLDRIDERVKLVGSIGYNWYDVEPGDAWIARAGKMRDEITQACRKDQAAAETAFPSTCQGPQLLDWLFAPDGKGGYRNPKEVAAFDAVYWGPAEKVARSGIGLTGEIARPRLEYFNFTTKLIENSLKQGALTKAIDLTNIPADFYTGKSSRRREITFSIGAYGFYRVGDVSVTSRALTLIPSVTYKHAFEKPDKVTICAAPPAGATIVTTEFCKAISPNDGKIVGSLNPALEARFYLPNSSRLFPWLVPAIGLAPKFSFEQRKDDNRRYSFDMPIWFGASSDGALNGGVALQHQWGGRDAEGELRPKDTAVSVFVSTTFDLGSK
jgi:hypothetical protein